MAAYTISKTSFLKFEQCSKAFFFYKKHPYLRDKISIDKALTFQRGHDVGFFARQLFPGGIDVSEICKTTEAAAEKTALLIAEKTPVIYEATFIYKGVVIMVDILTIESGQYIAYEVKSSIKVSENYLKDAYLQYFVLKNVLVGFQDLFLVTLNQEYVRNGPIEPRQLFKKRSVREKAEENFTYFQFQIDAANGLLERDAIPNIPIGIQCFRPYQCDYFGTCWKDTMHEKSIFNLPLADKGLLFEWHNLGLKNIDQLPDELIRKDALVKIKNAFVSGEPIMDREKIRKFLSQIKQPCAAMDMEIWSAAIPQLQGARPFEQIPFLVCFYDGRNFTDFFAGNQDDDRRTFGERLIALSDPYETILVYDKSMELAVIEGLIKKYPEQASALTRLKTKLVDVFEVFLQVQYYNPTFKNNFSLKAISAALLTDLNFSRITSGLEAMNFYERYRVAANEMERGLLRTELIDYCNTDSLATYRLVEFLAKL